MSGQPKYKTPAELEKKIDEYFEHIKGSFHLEEVENKKTGTIEQMKVWDRYPDPPTVTGLAHYLGFDSRQSFHDYKKRAAFSYTVKRARLRVEIAYEIFLTKSQNPAGAIFALKNLGWDDKSTTEVTGKDGGPVNYDITLNL